LKWDFHRDFITEEDLQKDFMTILQGFEKMKDILMEEVINSKLSDRQNMHLKQVIIDTFHDLQKNIIFTLLKGTDFLFFDILRTSIVNRINEYMINYTNQETNLLFLFAKEIWEFDHDFLKPRPVEEFPFVSFEDFFMKWLETCLYKYNAYPTDPMKISFSTENILQNVLTHIFEHVVYPIQEANYTRYENNNTTEAYYMHLGMIDRLTHMKDQLDIHFQEMVRSFESMFLRPRISLVKYGSVFLEEYTLMSQKFFEIDNLVKVADKTTLHNMINVNRLFNILSYFRMVPDDAIDNKSFIVDFPLARVKTGTVVYDYDHSDDDKGSSMEEDAQLIFGQMVLEEIREYDTEAVAKLDMTKTNVGLVLENDEVLYTNLALILLTGEDENAQEIARMYDYVVPSAFIKNLESDQEYGIECLKISRKEDKEKKIGNPQVYVFPFETLDEESKPDISELQTFEKVDETSPSTLAPLWSVEENMMRNVIFNMVETSADWEVSDVNKYYEYELLYTQKLNVLYQEQDEVPDQVPTGLVDILKKIEELEKN
jgi:hypothetical protein